MDMIVLGQVERITARHGEYLQIRPKAANAKALTEAIGSREPFPRPLNIFVNVALIFTVLMHGMQLALLQSTLPKDGPQMTTAEKVRIFLFGVFELLIWQNPAGLTSLSGRVFRPGQR